MLWIAYSIYLSKRDNMIVKIGFFIFGAICSIIGAMLYARLYIHISDDTFTMLKQIHHIGYYGFIAIFISHIASIIYKENYIKNGIISSMFRFVVILMMINPLITKAQDIEYTDGLLYLQAQKGYTIVQKTINNCPYDKCRKDDTHKEDKLNITTIDIKQPNYKKAIELLTISSNNLNPKASDKLLDFLLKRLDYKSSTPDEYLLKQLKEEIGINSYDEYKKLIFQTLDNGIKAKACYSNYFYGEVYEYGYFGVGVDEKEAKRYYEMVGECV